MCKDFVTPEGIEKRKYSYYTSCDCIGKEHGATLWVDDECGVSIGMDILVFPHNFWRRLKNVFKLLFVGYLEYSGDVIFRDSQHVRDVTYVLNHLADNLDEKNLKN